jgi:hypothetical protein
MISAIAALVAMAAPAFAQQPGAHQLKLKTDPAAKVGTILSSDGRLIQFQTPAGSIAFPLANIETVSMSPPPEYDVMQKSVSQRDTEKAGQAALGLTAKYKGLPVGWMKTVYVTAISYLIGKDLPKAKAMNAEMNQLYPGGGGLQAKVNGALISIEEKDMLAATDALVGVTQEALKAKSVPSENALAYSQAFYALGRVQEADGKLQDALENYLRTVTIFFNDPSSKAAAQERADALRARNRGKKASEQLTVP